MGHLLESIHINAPVDKVVHYSEDPHRWGKFMVGMSEPDKIIGDIGVGQQVELTTTTAGIHMHDRPHCRGPSRSGRWRPLAR